MTLQQVLLLSLNESIDQIKNFAVRNSRQLIKENLDIERLYFLHIFNLKPVSIVS